jgi:predicted DNA-binding transcriptional regulator AlpA
VANILRPKASWEKLGVSRVTFYDNYVLREGGDRFIPGTKVPRLRPPLKLGERARGFPDDEIDAVIEALRAERDSKLGNAAA